MNFLLKMFREGKIRAEDLTGKTTGELINIATNGQLLIDGKATYEIVHEKMHDLAAMLKCCEAEVRKYEITGLAPAPYYFERVAILARKEKMYDLEVGICEKYIEIMERIYGSDSLGVKAGPRYKSIVRRLPKAKALLGNA